MKKQDDVDALRKRVSALEKELAALKLKPAREIIERHYTIERYAPQWVPPYIYPQVPWQPWYVGDYPPFTGTGTITFGDSVASGTFTAPHDQTVPYTYTAQ